YMRNVDSSEMVAEGRTIYLLNATDGSTFSAKVHVPTGVTGYEATILNRYLEAQPGSIQLKVGANQIVSFKGAVEEGGVVILNPVSSGLPEKQQKQVRDEPAFELS